jgi:hypothetical protein
MVTDGLTAAGSLEDKIRDFFKDGKYKEAVDFLKKHLLQNAEDDKARMKLAEAFIYTGDKEGAVKEYTIIAQQFMKKGQTIPAITIKKKILDLQASLGKTVVEAGEKAAKTPADKIPEEIHIEGSKIPLFSDLKPEEFKELLKMMKIYRCPKGTVVVREGDSGQSMYIIGTGSATVTTKAKDGSVIQLAELGEGSFFGEVSLLTGRPRTATIATKEDTEVMELTKEALGRIIEKYPRVKKVMEEFHRKRVDSTIETLIKKKK